MATQGAGAGENRLFIPQEQLDLWLAEEQVELEGEVLTPKDTEVGLPGRFRLTMALLFLEEIAEGGDELSLVGTVKDMEQLEALGGEHCAGSVILGDNAYEVVEGFAGVPLDRPATPAAPASDEENSSSEPLSDLSTARVRTTEDYSPGGDAMETFEYLSAIEAELPVAPGGSLADAVEAAMGEGEEKDEGQELDLLARFFLQKK